MSRKDLPPIPLATEIAPCSLEEVNPWADSDPLFPFRISDSLGIPLIFSRSKYSFGFEGGIAGTDSGLSEDFFRISIILARPPMIDIILY